MWPSTWTRQFQYMELWLYLIWRVLHGNMHYKWHRPLLKGNSRPSRLNAFFSPAHFVKPISIDNIILCSMNRAVHCWENYSCRVKQLEFINAPTHINIVLNIFRRFMSAKLRERLLVTCGPSTIDVRLPSDLGGDGKSYAELTEHWKKKIQSYAAWFVEQDRFKSIV